MKGQLPWCSVPTQGREALPILSSGEELGRRQAVFWKVPVSVSEEKLLRNLGEREETVVEPFLRNCGSQDMRAGALFASHFIPMHNVMPGTSWMIHSKYLLDTFASYRTIAVTETPNRARLIPCSLPEWIPKISHWNSTVFFTEKSYWVWLEGLWFHSESYIGLCKLICEFDCPWIAWLQWGNPL